MKVYLGVPASPSFSGLEGRRPGQLSPGWTLCHFLDQVQSRVWWLTPVISAPQEAEMGRIEVQSQPGKK
jgi:hypothetical protein